MDSIDNNSICLSDNTTCGYRTWNGKCNCIDNKCKLKSVKIMGAREKLDEFAELRGLDKTKLLGWSIAADFAEWYAWELRKEDKTECKCGNKLTDK